MITELPDQEKPAEVLPDDVTDVPTTENTSTSITYPTTSASSLLSSDFLMVSSRLPPPPPTGFDPDLDAGSSEEVTILVTISSASPVSESTLRTVEDSLQEDGVRLVVLVNPTVREQQEQQAHVQVFARLEESGEVTGAVTSPLEGEEVAEAEEVLETVRRLLEEAAPRATIEVEEQLEELVTTTLAPTPPSRVVVAVKVRPDLALEPAQLGGRLETLLGSSVEGVAVLLNSRPAEIQEELGQVGGGGGAAVLLDLKVGEEGGVSGNIYRNFVPLEQLVGEEAEQTGLVLAVVTSQVEQEVRERMEQEQERAKQEVERVRQEQEIIARQEKERIDQETLEQDKLQREVLEQEILEQESQGQEEVEQEAIEKEKLEHEKLNQDILDQESLESESIESESIEQDSLEQAIKNQESLEQATIEQESLEPATIKQGMQETLTQQIQEHDLQFMVTTVPDFLLSGVQEQEKKNSFLLDMGAEDTTGGSDIQDRNAEVEVEEMESQDKEYFLDVEEAVPEPEPEPEPEKQDSLSDYFSYDYVLNGDKVEAEPNHDIALNSEEAVEETKSALAEETVGNIGDKSAIEEAAELQEDSLEVGEEAVENNASNNDSVEVSGSVLTRDLGQIQEVAAS